MLRSTLLAISGSRYCRAFAERAPFVRPIINRFVAGTDTGEVLTTAGTLASDRFVSVDRLGEDTTDRAQAGATVEAYRGLLAALGENGLAGRAEVSVKLSALGQSIGVDGAKIALDNARQVCWAAEAVGTTVTVDMENHTTTDATLDTVRELRADFPWVGAVLQAYLRRTEQDCADLAGLGSRVRLCKGAYDEPGSVAFRNSSEVDESYVRCLKVLMAGQGYPMVATHDPVLLRIAAWLAQQAGRAEHEFEYQMLYGVRPKEQERLAAEGNRVRVYVPYGTEWFGYFTRRLAERPANLAFFLRSFASKS